jgi:tetratricopeptide (TPR) repeat protein
MPIHDPLSPDEQRLLPLIAAIADGTPVDWPSINSPLTRQLQDLERLVQGHDAVRSIPPRQRPAHETLLTEARRAHAGVTEALRVQWGPLIVFEKVGRGSFGDVYRAWDPRLDREVALKLIPEEGSVAATSPVIEEGRLLARVRHPNVMTVYGADRCEGRTGIWTEYIRGETLAAEVARRGPVSSGEAARIGIDVCAALGAVHAAGMLHRDVKAQNILRDGSGRIVLGDFGTGVAVADDAGLSDPRIAGTPLYLAPEIISGGAPPTAASDLYGVGVLLYFLLTAAFPVRGRTLAEIKRAHARGEQVPLREACPAVPDTLAHVIETLLATASKERYQSAADAEAALRRTLPDSTPPPRHQGYRLATMTVAGAAVLTASLAGVAVWRGWTIAPAVARHNAPPFAVKAGDWIVVSEVVNHTGEPVLDVTLRAAIERELEYSDFVRVVQRDRIEDALKLLERPLDSPLSRDLALELSQRDGGIRALVTGAIRKAEAGYALTVEMIDPVSGTPVAAMNDAAATQADILAAVRRQTLRLREAMGEPASAIERSRGAFQRAVVPSLTALNLFTQAKSAIDLRDNAGNARLSVWVTLERIARDVIKEDPRFLGGWMALGSALARQGRAQEALPDLERALSHADGATPQEQYYVTAHIHSIKARAPGRPRTIVDRQELEKAAAALEALFALQPDHYVVRNNLRNIYGLLGRTRDRAWMNQRLADARPWSVAENFNVARQLLRDGNIEGAFRYGARAASSLSPGSSAAEPDLSAAVRLFPAYVAWVRDDADETLRVLRQVAGTAGSLPEPERTQLYLRLGAMYSAVGRLRDAAQAIDAARPGDRSNPVDTSAVDLARAALYQDAGDVRGLRAFAETSWREPLPDAGPALLGRRVPDLIAAGLLNVADRDLEWYKRRTAKTGEWSAPVQMRQFEPFHASNDAVIALKRGHTAAALDALRSLMPRMHDGTTVLFGPAGSQTFFAAMQMADALAANGNLAEAIATLEEAVSDRVAVISRNTPNRWLRATAQLASLYRRNGQGDQARAIEVRLSKLLAHADADHPLAAQLTARR